MGQIVDQYAADPTNPWAIAHALLARGPQLRLTNDKDAIDWLFSEFAEEFTAGTQTLIRFPARRDGISIEPHTDLMLKVLTEIGVNPDRVVTVSGNPYPIADLYRGSLIRSHLQPYENRSSYKSSDDIPWSTQALATWAPSQLTWLSEDGTGMNLNQLASFGVAVLEQETAFMTQAMASGAEFDRNGQGIFNYTCGGAHLIQGTGYTLARGFGDPSLRPTFVKQIPLMFYRLPRELAIYDAAMRRFGTTHTTALLIQRLKFSGHFLETMHKLAALGFYVPSQEQNLALEGAAKQVALAIEGLSQSGVLDNLNTLRQTNEQQYLDIIGDSSHAVYALQLAMGDRGIRY